MAGENVKNNLAARVDAVKIIPDNAVAGAKVFMDNLTELKPVQALMQGGSYLGRGVLSFINEQAAITRRWVGQVR